MIEKESIIIDLQKIEVEEALANGVPIWLIEEVLRNEKLISGGDKLN